MLIVIAFFSSDLMLYVFLRLNRYRLLCSIRILYRYDNMYGFSFLVLETFGLSLKKEYTSNITIRSFSIGKEY